MDSKNDYKDGNERVYRRGVGRGTLEVRKGGVWFSRWMWHGKRFSKSLGVFSGKNARQKAQSALDEIMKPYRAKTTAETTAHLTARAVAAVNVVSENEDRRPALRIDMAFEEFATHPQRPRRATKNAGKAMLAEYQSRFDRFVRWINGVHSDVLEMRSVTREIAFEYLGCLEKSLGPNSYNKHLTCLTMIWKTLHDVARITFNPWEGVQRLPLPKSVRRELTYEELEKIANVAKGEIWLLFAIGIYTGLRLGDAVRLCWESVDFSRNVITVEPTKTERFTKGRKIIIPIIPAFAVILEKASVKSRRGPIVPELSKAYQTDKGSLSKKVQKVFSDCGIETQIKADGEQSKKARVVVGFHSLRHTFVSIAATSGIPFAIVQEIVGHTSPAMTQHYLHVSEYALKENVSKFPAVFGRIENKSKISQLENNTLPRYSADGENVLDVILNEIRAMSPSERLQIIRACAIDFTATERAKALNVLSGCETITGAQNEKS